MLEPKPGDGGTFTPDPTKQPQQDQLKQNETQPADDETVETNPDQQTD